MTKKEKEEVLFRKELRIIAERPVKLPRWKRVVLERARKAEAWFWERHRK